MKKIRSVNHSRNGLARFLLPEVLEMEMRKMLARGKLRNLLDTMNFQEPLETPQR